MSKQLSLLIGGRNREALEQLQEICDLPGFVTEIKHISNGHADPLYGVLEHPDMLLFHMGQADLEELQCLVDHPADSRPPIVVVGPSGDTRLMRAAMRAGARDFLEDPADKDELHAALLQFQREQRHTDGAREGKLTAVVSSKGGAGASFLSVNLAHIMASRSHLETALVDLDLQFGSLAQYLDLRPESGLMRALDMADNIDAVAADACMVKHASALSLLAPLEDEIVLTRDVSPDRLNRVLELLKQNYDRVVVDLPRQIDELSATVYEHADQVLLIVQQELACLRDGVRLRQLLTCELGIAPEKILVVVNRYDKDQPVELKDICQSLNVQRSDVMVVPNNYRSVAESVNVGVPMSDYAKSSSVTKSIIALEAMLGGKTSQNESTGLFSRTLQMMRG